MSPNLRISCLPPNDWPEADRQALDAALDGSDLLDAAAVLSCFSERRKVEVRKGYGRWLGFVASLSPGIRIRSGLDHLDKDNVSTFIARLQADLAPYSVASYVTALATAVRAIKPDQGIHFLDNAARYLWRIATPQNDKRQRLRPSFELYELGFDLMCQSELVSDPILAAATFRDGLMIAFLAARPVRLANLAAIGINQHLEKKGNMFLLVFRSAEVKTRRHLEFPIPRDLVRPMEIYLSRYRPVLMTRNGRWNTGPHNGLWVSAHGSKLSAHRIETLICLRTRERFGQSISPKPPKRGRYAKLL